MGFCAARCSLSARPTNTIDLLHRLREAGHPLVLTITGKAELAVQDAAAYQALLDRVESIEGIQQGLADVKAGRSKPDVFPKKTPTTPQAAIETCRRRLKASDGCPHPGDEPMKRAKKERLERDSWVVADAATLVGLSGEEAHFVELKLALAAGVRHFRERRGLTQPALAKQLGSSQSRVAKMEAGDASVSANLMITCLLAIGAETSDIAAIIRRGLLLRTPRRSTLRTARVCPGPRRSGASPSAPRRARR